MSASDNEIIIKRAYKELLYAIVGTGITLVFAVGLYLWAPVMRDYLHTKKNKVQYTRTVTINGNTGRILYTSSGVETIEALQKDVDILSHRFERGEFRLLTIAQTTLKDASEAMSESTNAFDYNVEQKDGGVALYIKAKNNKATKAMSQYLKILDKHWQH